MKIFRYSLIIVFFVILSLHVFSQSPRVTLIEEATNASCVPCAAQNPTFEHYLTAPTNIDRIIPIIYHGNWPGRDVMNQANPTMHNALIQYYGITGVPTAVINGKIPKKVNASYDGAPSDTVALENAVKAAVGVSPLSIQISEQVNGTNVTVDVVVSSVNAVSSKKLRIAVVEGFHYYSSAGTNGEKNFYYIVRQMLPSQNGLDLSLNGGETKTATQSFSYDAAWTADEIYVVAFVQDDVTKEILQANSDKIKLNLQSTSAVTILNSTTNQPGEFDATISTPLTGDYTVTINPVLPNGWSSEVKINGAAVTSGSKFNLKKEDAPAPIVINITPADSKNRLGKVFVTIKGPRGASASETFKLYSRDITAITLVKDEGNPQIATYYEQAFEQGTTSYALVETADEKLFDLNSFSVIVCEVGKNALSQSDINLLKSFFDNGGRMYMIGAEIAWGLADPQAPSYGSPNDIDFLHTYLHADYINDDNPNTTVRGFANDPIGDGLYFSFTSGIQNQDTPDQISPRTGAVPILYYGSDQSAIAGIRYADKKNRLVYLGFGLEGMGALTQRSEILKRGIAWLLGTEITVGVHDQSANCFEIMNAFPNPITNSWSLPIQLGKNSHVKVELYDMLGRRITTLVDKEAEVGMTMFYFDRNNITSGSYLMHVTVGEARKSQVLKLIR